MSLVRLNNVTKAYRRGPSEVTAVADVSLELRDGEFAALVGPSGSGKTTLLNLIGALDAPSSGSVQVDGRDIGALHPDRLAELRAESIGFIFQTFNLIPVLTAAENVEYPLLLRKAPPPSAERRRRVRRLLDSLGLGDIAERRPPELSGGQHQRVAIARALIGEPRLVLADEPTASLDSVSGNRILDEMRQLHEREGTTFLFSTHDPAIVGKAKRILELRDGRLCADKVVLEGKLAC